MLSRLIVPAISTFVTSGVLASSIQFGLIGDYGTDDAYEGAIATKITSLNPEFIVTAGDDNYLGGGLSNWDNSQGKYYSSFIKYPAGSSSAYAANGVTQNRFYPTLGNHDWDAGVNEYTDYFDLPGNERYYNFTKGPVEFFILDSDDREPDGRTAGTTQYEWAKNAIQNSTARWQLVFFHHPAFTSESGHGPELDMRWPFAEWGVDGVFSGHNHHMEVMDVNGLPYYVVGTSGQELYGIVAPAEGATTLYSNDTTRGFAMINADENQITVDLLNDSGTILNSSIIPEPSCLFASLLFVGVLKRKRSAPTR